MAAVRTAAIYSGAIESSRQVIACDSLHDYFMSIRDIAKAFDSVARDNARLDASASSVLAQRSGAMLTVIAAVHNTMLGALENKRIHGVAPAITLEELAGDLGALWRAALRLEPARLACGCREDALLEKVYREMYELTNTDAKYEDKLLRVLLGGMILGSANRRFAAFGSPW
jgi:hypothetical protein